MKSAPLEVVSLMQRPPDTTRLTKESLQVLRELGFRHVLVVEYAPERYSGHIGLNRFKLVPVKELPEEPGKKGIYAPIDSEILDDWASQPDDGIEAFIEGYSQLSEKRTSGS